MRLILRISVFIIALSIFPTARADAQGCYGSKPVRAACGDASAIQSYRQYSGGHSNHWIPGGGSWGWDGSLYGFGDYNGSINAEEGAAIGFAAADRLFGWWATNQQMEFQGRQMDYNYGTRAPLEPVYGRPSPPQQLPRGVCYDRDEDGVCD